MSGDSVFSVDAYLEMIDALMRCGYVVRDYFDVRPESQHLIVRHDIDMCLDSALRLARAERAHNIRATYFVLLRSELYNLLAPPELDAVREICALGHGVGLHLDAAQYEQSIEALNAGAAHECEMLEALLGQPVNLISLHRPAAALLGSEATLGGRAHVYQPRWFSAIGYCSDSRGRWGHGQPLEQEAVAAGRALQLLTHPIWWTGPVQGTPATILDTLVVGADERFRRVLARECSAYQK
jgi:hypothetical protein